MCRDGWYDLIDVLCERLQAWTDLNGAPQVVVSEVKEKWVSFRSTSRAEVANKRE
jgi:hypothetical protein